MWHYSFICDITHLYVTLLIYMYDVTSQYVWHYSFAHVKVLIHIYTMVRAMRYFLQDIILCCSVLHCVAVCCSMLQHVYVTWLVHVTYSTFFKTLYCSVLQCVAVCCSVLQCVAVCWNVLQCVAVCCSTYMWCGSYKWHEAPFPRHYTAVCYSVLQCVAVCCSVL